MRAELSNKIIQNLRLFWGLKVITLKCIKINVNIFAGNMILRLVHSLLYVSEVNFKTQRESQNLMNISPSDTSQSEPSPLLPPAHISKHNDRPILGQPVWPPNLNPPRIIGLRAIWGILKQFLTISQKYFTLLWPRRASCQLYRKISFICKLSLLATCHGEHES